MKQLLLPDRTLGARAEEDVDDRSDDDADDHPRQACRGTSSVDAVESLAGAGEGTGSVMMSLGLGLAVLAAIGLVLVLFWKAVPLRTAPAIEATTPESGAAATPDSIETAEISAAAESVREFLRALPRDHRPRVIAVDALEAFAIARDAAASGKVLLDFRG